MFAKTALLTGAAVLMLSAAPALAQDQMTPPAPATQNPAPTPAPAPAAPGTMQIQPGSDVKGSDGAVLGKLEGVQTVAGAQQLKVRGSDGVLRGVSLAGLKQDGAGVAVAATTAEFQAAPAINEPAPAPATTTPPAADEPAPEATPDATTPPTA
ncbi:MAG: superoxide dismutase [Brevundimonas sp.]|uniref:superoxide dismutase n=1 Tax=Brevundimonas sp. TaxID=1871086 RepID=UPI0040337A41